MRAVRINERLAVAAQVPLHEIGDLPSLGYAALLNVRPDGEEAGQADAAAEAAAAEAAGLVYGFVPVTAATVTAADVAAFRQALAAASGPVLAHSRSGARALMLFALGEALAGRMAARDLPAFGAGHGFDLSAAPRWLERHGAQRPVVTGFYEERSGSVQYVVSDPATKKCAIIDPVLDYDEKSGSIATASADALLAHVAGEGLSVEWVLDTHPHADHLSAAHYLKGRTGAPTGIGERIVDVQELWKDIYNLPDLKADGSQWDRLFAQGERFKVGEVDAHVLFSPGHTLASVSYVIGDAAFVHDTLFMPDSGTARADFPGGSAHALWRSLQGILALPDETRLFTGHDYRPNGRAPRWESTVAEQKRANPHVAGKDEETFVRLREARDRTLPMPKLILHALQVNIRGGRLPEPEENGRRYLKIPLDALAGSAW